jgi:hypothetical protein
MLACRMNTCTSHPSGFLRKYLNAMAASDGVRPSHDCSDVHDTAVVAGDIINVVGGGVGDTFKSSSRLFSSMALIPRGQGTFQRCWCCINCRWRWWRQRQQQLCLQHRDASLILVETPIYALGEERRGNHSHGDLCLWMWCMCLQLDGQWAGQLQLRR